MSGSKGRRLRVSSQNSHTTRKITPFFVLGFGVNVNNALEDFPPELRGTATSVRMAHPLSENRNFEICRVSLLCDISPPPGKTLSAAEGGEDGFNYERV